MNRKQYWIRIFIYIMIISLTGIGFSACGQGKQEDTKEQTSEGSSEDFFPTLLSEGSLEPTEEDGAPVTLEDGNMLFIPGTNDIAQDEETGIRYIKGMIMAYTAAEPDEAMQAKLTGEVGGKIMGVQKGMVPLVEIRTDASDYSELESLSEKLEALPEVLFAFPEVELEMGLEIVNTLSEDTTPWSEDGNVIPDKGDENHPGGNDWWAEVIRAYSAWEATPDLQHPIPLGIVDNGVDMDHPEFGGHIYNANRVDINWSGTDDPDEISHGTFVAGIAAASGSNDIGIRGVADRSGIYFMDSYNKDIYTYTQGTSTLLTYTAYPNIISNCYSYMHRNGVRVINHSFGNNTVLTPEEYRTRDSKNDEDFDKVKNSLLKYNSYEDYYTGQQLIGKASVTWLLNYMLVELINGQEDFLYVQSAGNGSWFDHTPFSSDLNLYFCSIAEDIFNEQIRRLRENGGLSPEQQERLDRLTWTDFRDHYMIVGGSTSEQLSETEYAAYQSTGSGPNVDICAPATDGSDKEKILGINTSTADEAHQYIRQSGTSIAAPMVTGAATLVWSIAPELPASEIKKILTECTDKKVTDPFGDEHPLLNVGLAVEYTKYYTFVRDCLIPRYGLQKGAQEGILNNYDESWLEPEGIVTSWIGNLDGQTGDEMVVFRFEKDPESDYSNREYKLVLDLFTIYNGTVQILDTLHTDFSLSKKYFRNLDVTVSAAPQGDWTDILIDIDEQETDLYGSDRQIHWIVTSDGETLAIQDGDTSAYETRKRIFDISNKNSRANKAQDHFTFLVTDGCRLTWYLDFVFTDKYYTPAGYISEYAPEAGQTVVTSDEDVIRSVLWSNPPNPSGEPRLVRTEDYKDGALSSFDQYAYDADGLLIYKGYFHKEGDLSSIIKYDYDMAGGMIRETEILATGKWSYEISYDNDDRGNQIRKYSVPEGGGELTDWNEYEYDAAGNQIKWLGYRNKELEFYWEYSYDANGNKIAWARYDADGNRTQAQTLEYDAGGHLLSTHSIDDKSDYEVDSAYEWLDDFHTRRSPWFHSNNGELAGYDIYTYDDYGNILSFRVQDTDGKITSERYYYYDNGSLENVNRPGITGTADSEDSVSGVTEQSGENEQDAVKENPSGTLSGISYQFAGNGNDPGNLYRYNAIGFYNGFVYFCEQPAGAEQPSIYRVSTEGGETERITEMPGVNYALGFTVGDDGYLYYTWKNQVCRVPVDGGSTELLATIGSGANSVQIGGFTLYDGRIYLTYNDGGTGGFSRLVDLDPESKAMTTYSIGNNDLGADNVIWGAEKGIFSAHVFGGQVMLYPWSGMTEETAIQQGEIEHHDLKKTSFRVRDGESCLIGEDARAILMEDGSVGVFEYEGRLFGPDDKGSEPDRILYSPDEFGQTDFFRSQYMFELSECYVGVGVNRGKVETFDKNFQKIETTGELHPKSGEGHTGRYNDHVYYLSIEPHYAEGELTGKDYTLYTVDKFGHIEAIPFSI